MVTLWFNYFQKVQLLTASHAQVLQVKGQASYIKSVHLMP